MSIDDCPIFEGIKTGISVALQQVTHEDAAKRLYRIKDEDRFREVFKNILIGYGNAFEAGINARGKSDGVHEDRRGLQYPPQTHCNLCKWKCFYKKGHSYYIDPPNYGRKKSSQHETTRNKS